MHSRKSAHRVLVRAASIFPNYFRVESVDAGHFSLLKGSCQRWTFPFCNRSWRGFTSSPQSNKLPGTKSGQDLKNGVTSRYKIQRHLSQATSVLRGEPVGLYGYGVLKSPHGFQAFAQEAIDRSEDIINQIKELPPSMATIRAFDDISDVVCTVVDAAELCRNTHPDKDFVREANKASMKIYEYLQYLNSHPVLYKAVVDVENSTALTTEEAKRAAKTLRVDFERGGIHLPPDKLKRASELNLEITRLGREFTENVIYEQGQLDIFPSTLIPQNLQTMMEPITKFENGMVRRSRAKKGSNAGMTSGLRMSTEPGVLFPVLKYVPDPEVRRKAYLAGNSVPKSNLRVLDHLICARHELAQLLGYNSYAEFALAPTMAKKPEAVLSFLTDLSTRIRGKADDDLKMVGEYRKQLEAGIDSSIQAWDEAYYFGLFKTRVHDLTATAVASYFPLTSCIEGLRVISQSLFNATFEQVPMGPNEAWHPDVQKLTLRHATEGDLGHMYLDLYARPGKFPGCAHFTLKGCRRLTESEYQLPVVALVCNFSSPHASEAPVLNHWEVEALFHEFGHALHSLLSRTEYQHFSGTRTSVDFSEIPAHLFEYYAWDYRVLSKFAKHYLTGEPIPQKLVESMTSAKRLLATTEIQRQVLFALIDQSFFGTQPLPAKDTTAVVAHLKHRHTSMKHVDGTHWQTRFNHLVNYGAGYYCYLYARCFAASIWQQHCQEDPLNLETGEKLRRGLLEFGGARDPAHMLQELLGNDLVVASPSGGISPSPQHMLAELGL
ncbi:hypothetical protein R1sor_004170 [Riccia sorocarpa]|uniref:Peptidase M3A/M3B catalytic domain-containing protein n=1 Tax=Riccia sorocarpa TaxID=122646 RepID=A0ABD3H3Q9_9MARC